MTQWLESLERYYTMKTLSDTPKTFRLSYHDMRVSQLQALDKDILINDIIAYELELLDLADRLLSDESLPLDSKHGYEIIELLGDDVADLVKQLDTNKELGGIRGYIYW